MEYLRIQDVQKINTEGVRPYVMAALDRLKTVQETTPQVIMSLVGNGQLEEQLRNAESEIMSNPRAATNSQLAPFAGAYFANEEVIGGSRVSDALAAINATELTNPMSDKIKLGPGVGAIQAPGFYQYLLRKGYSDVNRTVNYTAPFGTVDARRGIKAIMDARIDPECDFFSEDGVFITQGATEGIDLGLEAISKQYSGSRVVFLGPSYYTGPFSAAQKGLQVDRLLTNPVKVDGEVSFFPSAQEIKDALPADTRLLVITSPNNPNGEIYSDNDLTEIFKLAKERNMFVLLDSIFESLSFNSQDTLSPLSIAEASGALDRLIVVDSLSKTMNFPGERVGYMATTNKVVADELTNLVLARRCNPQLTLGPLLEFEGLARQVNQMARNNPQIRLETIVKELFSSGKSTLDQIEFLGMYDKWQGWNREVNRYYADNLQLTRAILNGSIEGYSPDKAAFNTFVKPQGLPVGTNSMDFLAKLMFTQGVYTQVGPCFGLSQKMWDNNLGVWSRITYACSRKDLIEGVTRLIAFSKFYAERNFGDPNAFPTLQISYDNQI